MGGKGAWPAPPVAVRVEAVLGFAQASGRLVSGDLAVARQLQRGGVHLVIIAADSGRRTVKRFQGLCEAAGVPWRLWGKKEELGRLIGKPPRAVIGVLDPAFASRLQEALPSGAEGSGPNDLR